MAIKNQHRGCLFPLYHPPTDLHYTGAMGYRFATPHNKLWMTWFTNNPIILHLIRVFGKETFVVTIEQTFEHYYESVEALHQFYAVEQPQFKSDWITDKKLPKIVPPVKRPIGRSHKGRNNPNYGRRHKNNPIFRLKYKQGCKALYYPKRWVVDENGKEWRIPLDRPIPKGWRVGRNTRTHSRW